MSTVSLSITRRQLPNRVDILPTAIFIFGCLLAPYLWGFTTEGFAAVFALGLSAVFYNIKISPLPIDALKFVLVFAPSSYLYILRGQQADAVAIFFSAVAITLTYLQKRTRS